MQPAPEHSPWPKRILITGIALGFIGVIALSFTAGNFADYYDPREMSEHSVENTGTNTFDVMVINSSATGDTIPPKIIQPNMITVDSTTANGAIVEYKIPMATDNTAVTYGPICTPKSGSFFEIGSNTVTCIAKDDAGNQGSIAFLVKVDSKIAIPEEVKTSVSVNVGKKQYQNDEAIFITGSANPFTKEKVNLEIRDSVGSLVGI